MDGKGKYIFPDGSYYKGEMKDGMFHGQGTMYFKGHGKYKAEWCEGVVVKGEYTFADGLVYKEENWDYCTEKDRRFFNEIQYGLRPAGATLFANVSLPESSATTTPRSPATQQKHSAHDTRIPRRSETPPASPKKKH
eukprot:Phypoly_transcript_24710.p1 GENE.Phypoly_transcript_24710~~Phypoly_transcript_24710.p1  ORF type:complete len:159 (+),score=31.25 Phypoly_transcript_24710:69-479(+)